jgi:sulfite oxidase
LPSTSALAVTEMMTQAAEPDALEGKDRRLITITTDPLVLETPDELLAANRITPVSALFVRNHHGAKPFLSMEPRPLDGDLEISGLIGESQRVPFRQIASLDETEVEMVLQCTGNFRLFFSEKSPIQGTPWSKGGVGNVRFRGVPIAALFNAIGLRIDAKARFLAASGADEPENPTQFHYEKSVPLDVALCRGLLATEMNDDPIPALHGGPVRLVIPGYYGSTHVKWLTRLRLDAAESTNYFQATDYRMPTRLLKPGESFTPTPENSVPAMDMRINSRILSPSEGSTVAAEVPVKVKGVAWNDGAAALTSVELSNDGGRTWHAATLAAESSPYAFREWSHAMVLSPGRHELWSRAVDAFGRTQPIEGALFWNPGGYCWNGVDKVVVSSR